VTKNIELSETDRDLPKHVKNGFMRYRDFAPLTQGGEAILRTCVDENLGRTVVMKTLQPQFQNLETYQKRFLREARVTAQIPHPATIPVYELSRDSEGNAYFTMKKLGGRDMSDILDQISANHQPTVDQYPLEAMLNVLIQAAQCLAYAHNSGVVHRDMKPANIMIGDYGEVMDDNDDVDQLIRSGKQVMSGRLTGRGDVQGTPFYMSPEQAVETGDVDERSDIYSMGIILFEVLTGESYMSGKNFKEIKRKLQEGPVREPARVAPKKKIPPELNAICVKALQRQPVDRYQKMSMMADDMRAAMLGNPVSVYREPFLSAILKWRDRKIFSVASLIWMLAGATIAVALQILFKLI
jgi:serine/threonine protein kinase